MKRSGLARRTGLKRGLRLRSKSRRRAGLSAEERDELKHLHTRAVMLRAGAVEVWEDSNGRRRKWPAWWGNCEWCGRPCMLATCHVESQGRCPHLKFDPENAWAGCYHCHIRKWHANPREAEAWITQKIGPARRQALAMRAQSKQKSDPELVRLVLELEIRRLESR